MTQTWVKTANKRSKSSTRWLERQLNDPYVEAAKRASYRSRAAFKIIELNDQFALLKKGQIVVDLGSAPGGWSQIAAPIIGEEGRLIAIDLLEMEPLNGVEFIQGDFLDDKVYAKLQTLVGDRKVDVILSDMAPSTIGQKSVDHLRVMHICEVVLEFVFQHLKPGGSFVIKFFKGGGEGDYIKLLKNSFTKVRNAKPPSSRAESSESYLVATGFKGMPVE